ncbi:MAG: sigma-54-dependent Fis family transcriptional regulator, partial [Proteobacteria bacterium]
MQVKLLRVLQEKKFTPVGGTREVKTNTRIIAATNRNLEKMMEDGTFREDLFYRLNVMPIFLPPLRDRIDDIPALVPHFIKKFAKEHNSAISSISQEALAVLKTYRWPGNIRELENVIERAFIVENSQQITAASLPENFHESKPAATVTAVPTGQNAMQAFGYAGPLDFDAFKDQMERDFIVSALKANNGRINQTVALANIPKNTLLRKIRKYNINVKDYIEE